MKNFKLVLMTIIGFTCVLGAADAQPTTAPAPVKTAAQVTADKEVVFQAQKAALELLVTGLEKNIQGLEQGVKTAIESKNQKSIELAVGRLTLAQVELKEVQAQLAKLVNDNMTLVARALAILSIPLVALNNQFKSVDKSATDYVQSWTEKAQPYTDKVKDGYNSTVTFVTTRPVTMTLIVGAIGAATYYGYTQFRKPVSKNKVRS